ncbi:MAG TPA: hypothetical protein VFF06_12415 [Polyangia bacterium]|nr:hypothetical protein [Polyangia bacterium]
MAGHRAAARALACAMAACALDGCAGTFAIAGRGSTLAPLPPDPSGPCLQQVAARRRGVWLWRDGVLVPHNDLIVATREDPEANRLARGARARDRALLPLWGATLPLFITSLATGAALSATGPPHNDNFFIGWGIGATLFVGSSVAMVALGISGSHRAERARATYNDWARVHGCTPP